MRSLKKAINTILIVSMILTSQAFYTFSNSVNNVDDNSNTETTIIFEEEPDDTKVTLDELRESTISQVIEDDAENGEENKVLINYEEEPENDETLVADENNESVEEAFDEETVVEAAIAKEMTTEETTTEEMTTEETTTEEMTTEETTTEEIITEEVTTEEIITEEATTEETKVENTEVDETEVSEVDKVETKNELKAHNSNNKLYGDGSETTYTVHYDENVPEGFEIERGWIDDTTATDIEAGITIESNSIGRLLCTNGSHKKLVRWNTSADGTGTNYDLGAVINDPSVFTNYVLTLYAVWDKTYLSNPAFVVNFCEGDLSTKKYAMVTDLAEYSSFENYIWNPINDNIPEGKAIIGYYSIPVQYVSRDEDEDMQDYFQRARNTIAENYNPENPDYIDTNIEQEWEVNWRGINADYDVIWGVVYGDKQYNIKYVDKYFGTDLTPYFENHDSTLVHRGTDGHFPAFSNLDSTSIIEDYEIKRYLYINNEELVEVEDGLEMPSTDVTIYVEGNKGILPPMFKMLETVELVTDNMKINYLVGETLKTDGLVLKLVFTSGLITYLEYTADLVDFIKFSVDLTKGLTANMKSVVITFAGRQLTYNINVKKSDVPSGGGGNSSSGGGGGGASDPTKGPMGVLTKNPLYNFNLNTNNNIPNNKMITNSTLAVSLLSNAENAGRTENNVIDMNGNTGFGKWQKLQGTNNWYFIAGNVTDGNFLSNNWFNVSWKGGTGWYHFDSTGLMQTGWYNDNGKLYYFNENPTDTNYGKSVVGTININGTTYNFDSTGALIQ